MRTTLNFDDLLIRAAKKRAADEGETLTRLIACAGPLRSLCRALWRTPTRCQAAADAIEIAGVTGNWGG